MSSFMTESQPSAPSSAQTSTQEDIALMQRVLRAAAQNPNLIPDIFMPYVVDFVQTSRLQIPIGQVPGFAQFTPTFLRTPKTPVSITATSASALPDTDFRLTGLPDGRYVILFGANMEITSVGAIGNYLTLTLSGSPGAFNDGGSLTTVVHTALGIESLAGISTWIASNAALGGSNFLQLLAFITGSPTALIGDRWVLALRYANL